MPVTILAQAAQSRSLPQPLRRSIAMMTWVRAVMLNNETVAARMFPMLPDKLRQEAGPGVGFHPMLAILRILDCDPTLRPGMASSTWAGADLRLGWFFHPGHWLLLAHEDENHKGIPRTSCLDSLGLVDGRHPAALVWCRYR